MPHLINIIGVRLMTKDSFYKQDRRSTSVFLPAMGNSVGSLGAKGNYKESEKERAGESWKQCVDKLDGEEKTVGDSNAGLTCENQENHHVSNIVLLRSRKHSRSTLLSGEPPQMPSSLDDNVKVTREVSSRSLHFSDGISSSLELRSQVPPSSPLSFDLEIDSEDMRLTLSCKKEPSGGTTSHSKTASRRIFDQEKKRDPSSPSKRFSISLGRLSRSFTFKEEDSSAGGQPLTSTINSDSKRCDGPSQSSNPEEKHCGGSRVSPLRRLLLDPLLKSKGSENVVPSKERSTSYSSSNPKPTNMDEKKKKQEDTSALFQLTTRNGIPLFQFVVDDDNSRRSILGATMKNSASSFKDDDSVQYCTFYSVNEVKKKRSGSWRLIHGHKEKQQHRFVYNVIGQMRLCNSSTSSDITEQKSEKVSSVIREAVLVDETEQAKGRKELAAVVIKKEHAEETLEETTVIIPGGVHSFPEKGAPTPLVIRWRSGGLCDCGGWDVGCKLHVLSNKTLLHELDQSFKLFAQEESDQESGPVLAMTELKTGIFRVEFGSFLSHLQAFFVCVTVITCASSEEKMVSKTTGRSSSPFAPPLSPVGRV
ncbi:hypothetical protein N665_0496s0043 [Sinapis alba]|nr:hypothetical protein N665_0496s0043 [Sinapis alba]